MENNSKMRMTFSIYTDSISPHQVPVAEALRGLGCQVTYIYYRNRIELREALGWKQVKKEWMHLESDDRDLAYNHIYNDDILLSGERATLALMRERCQNGKLSFFMSERWFKPSVGFLRLLKPSFFKMAMLIVSLFNSRNTGFYYLPIGIHAARDMSRLVGLFHGDVRCLFCAPKLTYDPQPGGRVRLANGADGSRYGLDKMRMWGYFVQPSACAHLSHPQCFSGKLNDQIRIVWLGRFMKCKRISTIFRAIGLIARKRKNNGDLPIVTADVYGYGADERRIKQIGQHYAKLVSFHPPVDINKVRQLMREHDLFILASDGYEGWGATLSEAMEEDMNVLGTYEAGASATMLPTERLYHYWDYRKLSEKILSIKDRWSIGKWQASYAAEALFNVSKEMSSHA